MKNSVKFFVTVTIMLLMFVGSVSAQQAKEKVAPISTTFVLKDGSKVQMASAKKAFVSTTDGYTISIVSNKPLSKSVVEWAKGLAGDAIKSILGGLLGSSTNTGCTTTTTTTTTADGTTVSTTTKVCKS